MTTSEKLSLAAEASGGEGDITVDGDGVGDDNLEAKISSQFWSIRLDSK